MDNFDLKKYLVENKLTAGSRLNEDEIGEMATLIKKSSSLENEKPLQVDDLIMWNELDYSNDRGMGPNRHLNSW
jgi:hypothetical protein